MGWKNDAEVWVRNGEIERCIRVFIKRSTPIHHSLKMRAIHIKNSDKRKAKHTRGIGLARKRENYAKVLRSGRA